MTGILDPQILAQLAAAGFRPPQTPTMPGFNLQPGLASPQQQTPGFNVSDGMAGLGMGLNALKGVMGGGLNPSGMPEDQNLGAAVAGIDALKPDANGVWQQPKMPTDIGYGQGGAGAPDFLTGIWQKLFG